MLPRLMAENKWTEEDGLQGHSAGVAAVEGEGEGAAPACLPALCRSPSAGRG